MQSIDNPAMRFPHLQDLCDMIIIPSTSGSSSWNGIF
jgi:hypothetical protein